MRKSYCGPTLVTKASYWFPQVLLTDMGPGPHRTPCQCWERAGALFLPGGSVLSSFTQTDPIPWTIHAENILRNRTDTFKVALLPNHKQSHQGLGLLVRPLRKSLLPTRALGPPHLQTPALSQEKKSGSSHQAGMCLLNVR